MLLRIVYIPALSYRPVARGSVVSGAGSITAWPAQASDRAKSGRNKTVSVTTVELVIDYLLLNIDYLGLPIADLFRP